MRNEKKKRERERGISLIRERATNSSRGHFARSGSPRGVSRVFRTLSTRRESAIRQRAPPDPARASTAGLVARKKGERESYSCGESSFPASKWKKGGDFDKSSSRDEGGKSAGSVYTCVQSGVWRVRRGLAVVGIKWTTFLSVAWFSHHWPASRAKSTYFVWCSCMSQFFLLNN